MITFYFWVILVTSHLRTTDAGEWHDDWVMAAKDFSSCHVDCLLSSYQCSQTLMSKRCCADYNNCVIESMGCDVKYLVEAKGCQAFQDRLVQHIDELNQPTMDVSVEPGSTDLSSSQLDKLGDKLVVKVKGLLQKSLVAPSLGLWNPWYAGYFGHPWPGYSHSPFALPYPHPAFNPRAYWPRYPVSPLYNFLYHHPAGLPYLHPHPLLPGSQWPPFVAPYPPLVPPFYHYAAPQLYGHPWPHLPGYSLGLLHHVPVPGVHYVPHPLPHVIPVHHPLLRRTRSAHKLSQLLHKFRRPHIRKFKAFAPYSLWSWTANQYASLYPAAYGYHPLSWPYHPAAYGYHPFPWLNHPAAYGYHPLSWPYHPAAYGYPPFPWLHHPAAYGYHPRSWPYHPAAYGYHPLSWPYHPAAYGYHPFSWPYHPAAYGYHPLSWPYHPAAYGYHPLSWPYHPAAYGYHPFSNLYHPAAYGYHPFSWPHHPAAYGYHPLSWPYHPAGYDYHPFPWLHHPAVYGYHPFSWPYHPVAYGHHPLSWLQHPATFGYHPLAWPYHPPAYVYHPLSWLYHPATYAFNPLPWVHPPIAYGYHPFTWPYHPPAFGYHPFSWPYHPPAFGYHPFSWPYHPPAFGYHPFTWPYHPPAFGYHPFTWPYHPAAFGNHPFTWPLHPAYPYAHLPWPASVFPGLPPFSGFHPYTFPHLPYPAVHILPWHLNPHVPSIVPLPYPLQGPLYLVAKPGLCIYRYPYWMTNVYRLFNPYTIPWLSTIFGPPYLVSDQKFGICPYLQWFGTVVKPVFVPYTVPLTPPTFSPYGLLPPHPALPAYPWHPWPGVPLLHPPAVASYLLHPYWPYPHFSYYPHYPFSTVPFYHPVSFIPTRPVLWPMAPVHSFYSAIIPSQPYNSSSPHLTSNTYVAPGVYNYGPHMYSYPFTTPVQVSAAARRALRSTLQAPEISPSRKVDPPETVIQVPRDYAMAPMALAPAFYPHPYPVLVPAPIFRPPPPVVVQQTGTIVSPAAASPEVHPAVPVVAPGAPFAPVVHSLPAAPSMAAMPATSVVHPAVIPFHPAVIPAPLLHPADPLLDPLKRIFPPPAQVVPAPYITPSVYSPGYPYGLVSPVAGSLPLAVAGRRDTNAVHDKDDKSSSSSGQEVAEKSVLVTNRDPSNKEEDDNKGSQRDLDGKDGTVEKKTPHNVKTVDDLTQMEDSQRSIDSSNDRAVKGDNPHSFSSTSFVDQVLKKYDRSALGDQKQTGDGKRPVGSLTSTDQEKDGTRSLRSSGFGFLTQLQKSKQDTAHDRVSLQTKSDVEHADSHRLLKPLSAEASKAGEKEQSKKAEETTKPSDKYSKDKADISVQTKSTIPEESTMTAGSPEGREKRSKSLPNLVDLLQKHVAPSI